MGLKEISVRPVRLHEGSKHRWTFKATSPDKVIDPALCDEFTQVYDAIWYEPKRCLTLLGPYAYKHVRQQIPKITVHAYDANGTEIQRQTAPLKKSYRATQVPLKLTRRPDHINIDIPAFDIQNAGLSITNSLVPVRSFISTLQKNNSAVWISDWVRYYLALGVDRVIIYDNGSENIDDIRNALQEINGDTVLVHWPFPYGDPSASKAFMAQIGALRHATKLNQGSGWQLNFDIDEYLVIKQPLEDFLRNKYLTGLMHIPSYWAISTDAGEGIARAVNQVWRMKDEGAFGKYLVALKTAPKARVHTAVLRFPFRAKSIKSDDAYYLHYRGLNGGWKESGLNRATPQTPDPNIHIKDTSVADTFRSIEQPTSNATK